MRLNLLAFITLFIANLISAPLWAATQLFGTVGVRSDTTTLVELDPDTGALISSIGKVGYWVTGLTFDETTETLYGVTSPRDDNFPSGLISIDLTTGQGTPIGPGNMNAALNATPMILAANSTGELYGWARTSNTHPSPNRGLLIRWDKTTGIATVVGNSGENIAGHGMAFDNSDTLYVFKYNGFVDEINTTTAQLTPVASGLYSAVSAHHGDFNPDTNIYYGIDQVTSNTNAPKSLLVIDLANQSLENTLPTVTHLHTVAFGHVKSGGTNPGSNSTATQSIPSLSIWAMMIALLAFAVFAGKRLRRS